MPMDWWMALAGGALIGLSAAALMFFQGRVAGISGILAGVVTPRAGELSWRALFLGGLLTGGAAAVLVSPAAFADTSGRGLGFAVAAGLLVGLGTRLGNGCTSGHGVCGISRFSVRSLLATITFIAAGALTVFVVGGAA